MRFAPATPADDLVDESQLAIGLPYAGLGRRLFAFLIDLVAGLIFSVLFWAGFLAVAGFIAGLMGVQGPIGKWAGDNLRDLNWRILPLVSYFIYHTLLEARSGATAGKRMLGVRVVSDTGRGIDWSASVVRNLLRPIDMVGGFLFALPSSQRQRLGDRAASTVVVRATGRP
jgi:uncharacterized RDD family membrane protein YckC